MIRTLPQRRRLISAVALTALTAVPVAAQDAPAKHLLRYRYQKGAIGYYDYSQNAKVNVQVDKHSMDSTMDMKMSMSMRIADVKDGRAVVEVLITRVAMKMANPMGGKIEFDTKDEDSVPAMFDHVLDVIGKPIEISMDDRGEVKVGKVPDAMQSMTRAGIDLEQMFTRFVAPFPEEPVAVGDTWKTETEHKLGSEGAVAMEVDNKLLSVEGNAVTIGMKMKIDLNGPALPGKVEIDEATGKITVDLSTGLQKGTTNDMKMTMAVNENGMAMDMKMDMKMAITPVAAPAKDEKAQK